MLEEKCPGSREIHSPYPEEIRCLWCDTMCEIWSDEIEAVCKGCGLTISRVIHNVYSMVICNK